MRRTLAIVLAAMVLVTGALPAYGLAFNPQEVAMVVENFLVDTDATIIGFLDHDAGNTHGDTTFTYRSSYIGPPDSALPSVPIGSRTEWQAWRGATMASINGVAYVIDYAGHLKDTRASAGDDPTYDIRWESTWWRNNPTKTGDPYAEGAGGFKFDDPDFDFSIEVDPARPNNVTLGGSASTTLWGVVGVSISGKKNFGTGVLTASAGVSVDIPLVSDVFGSLASGEFELTYNQKTGRYSSKIKGEAFFGLLSAEKTVNRGRVVAPAKKVDPPDPDPPRSRPVNAGTRNNVGTAGGLGTGTPPLPGYIVAPWQNNQPVLTPNPYDPYGELAQITMETNPDLFNFNTVPVTQPSAQAEYLYPHPGFFDPVTFPDDDPPLIPGGGIGFGYMDPLDPFGGTGGGPPPGITIGPVAAVPEPATMTLFTGTLIALYLRRRKRR